MLVVAGVLAGGGAYVVGDGGEPPEGTAHVWVDTDGGTCDRVSSPAAYASASACASLDDAYVEADPGDTVGVADGDYSSQAIDLDAAKAGTTDVITFVGDDMPRIGAGAESDGLTLNGPHHITFDGIEVDGDLADLLRWC